MTRFLLYSHDSYGLGHFRRSSLLAAGLAGATQDNEVLIVTGSPRAESFPLPERVDTVKLPSATKDAAGDYRPRKLGCGIAELIRLRSTLACATVAAFEPDTILIDHAPLGMASELMPLFERLDVRARRPRMVLGLRDIIDDAAKVDRTWSADGTWDVLHHFDDLLVYGDPAMQTTATELDLAGRTQAPVLHTGYIAPAAVDPVHREPYLLVTVGGGGDGHGLLRRYFDAVEAGATAPLRSVVVAGPLLSARRRAEFIVRAAKLPSVELIEFSTEMRTLIASATGVISMAGYNTVVEELRARVPTLLVPRSTPRLEQHLRARRLAEITPMRHVPLAAVTPAVIRDFAASCLTEPRPETTIDLGGIDRVVELLADPRAVRPSVERRAVHV